MSFRLIVGLGNPGSEYAATRHNVGFRVIEEFASRAKSTPWEKSRKLKCESAQVASSTWGKLILLKPQTYMNESGTSIQKVCSYYKVPPEEMIVIYDEINLDVGQIKASVRGSAGGHNGLEDILEKLAPRFARLRIGVGQKRAKEMDLADHVLGRFDSREEEIFNASMDAYIDSLSRLLVDGPEKAMIHINRKQTKNDNEQS